MLSPADLQNTFIIMPAFNEQGSIETVVNSLLQHRYQIVVVDDGSQPSLFSILKNKPLYYLRHGVNLGQGAALQTGIDFAITKNASFIVTFDADGQHEVSDIEKMLEHLTENNLDVLLGSRFIQDSATNIGGMRRAVLKTARFVNYVFTGVLLSDAHNGLRVMTVEAAKKIKITDNGMSHATEIISIIHKLGLRYKEFPVTIRYTNYSRQKGQSAWNSFRIIFDLLLNKVFK